MKLYLAFFICRHFFTNTYVDEIFYFTYVEVNPSPIIYCICKHRAYGAKTMAKLMFRRMAFSGENPILSLFPPPGGREGGGGDNWIKINLSTLGGSIPSYLMNVINLLQIYEIK